METLENGNSLRRQRSKQGEGRHSLWLMLLLLLTQWRDVKGEEDNNG